MEDNTSNTSSGHQSLGPDKDVHKGKQNWKKGATGVLVINRLSSTVAPKEKTSGGDGEAGTRDGSKVGWVRLPALSGMLGSLASYIITV